MLVVYFESVDGSEPESTGDTDVSSIGGDVDDGEQEVEDDTDPDQQKPPLRSDG